MKKLLWIFSNFRNAVWAVFVVSFIGVLASLFAQYVLGMNPCVMCIQQRLALIGIVVLSLLVQILPLRALWARTVAVLTAVVPAVFGLYIAVKQIYLQSLPLEAQPSCGAPWTFRWRGAPLFDVYEPLIRGTGACGEVYHVLGVSLPVWGALFFAAVMIVLIWAYWQTRRMV